MDQHGVKSRVNEMVGINDKWQVTAGFWDSYGGLFYAGKCHPKFQFPLGWHITQLPKLWLTEETMVQ